MEKNKLKPNVKYQTGEFNYFYETDDQGRIKNWHTDKLQLTKRENRLPHDGKTPDKLSGDDAGHLAGDRFGGSPKLDNLVSQARDINRKEYKKYENLWAKALKDEKEVTVNVDVLYGTDSARPTGFQVEYTVEGEYFEALIGNSNGGEE